MNWLIDLIESDREFKIKYNAWLELTKSVHVDKLFDEICEEIIDELTFDGNVGEKAIYKVAQYDFVRKFKSVIVSLSMEDKTKQLFNLMEGENE